MHEINHVNLEKEIGFIQIKERKEMKMKADERNKGVVFKNCVPFINCISEKDNIGIHIAKDIDTAMPIYNLTE